MLKNKLKLLAILLLITTFFTACAWYGHRYYQKYTFNHIVPAKDRDQISFPLYLPDDLPNGYVLDKDSISSTPYVLSYFVTYDRNKKLIFTLQPKPAEIDAEEFGKERLLNSKDMSLPYGRASIGLLRSITTASIATDETWIIITAPDGVNDRDLRAIIRSLKAL